MQSDLNLPELAPWPGEARGSCASVEVRRGEVATASEWIRDWTGAEGEVIRRLGRHAGGLLLSAGDFQYELNAEGTRATWSSPRDEAACARAIVHELLPTAFAKQGHYIIHASAFQSLGGVVAIAGFSGTGKSTLAAAMGGGLGGVFSDDVLWIDPESAECWPGFAGSWLTGAALEAISEPGAVEPRQGDERHFVAPVKAMVVPGKLRALIEICESDTGEEMVFASQPLSEAELLFTLLAHWMHPAPEDAQAVFLKETAALANRTPALRIKLPDALAALPECVGAIEEALAQPSLPTRSIYDVGKGCLLPA